MQNCEKYLFLDIDGVLNHRAWYKNLEDKTYPFREFDPECVKRVNYILEKTNARLVITSSWRLDSNIKQIFYKVGMPTIFDCTPFIPGKSRGYEIIKYFGDNIDYIIEDLEEKSNVSSTIVDVSTSEVKVLRQGDIKL